MLIKLAGGGVGLANLQEMGARPARRFGSQKLGRDPKAPEIGVNGYVQDFALAGAHLAGNDEASDLAAQHGDPANGREVDLGLPPRTFALWWLDAHDLNADAHPYS